MGERHLSRGLDCKVEGSVRGVILLPECTHLMYLSAP